MSEQLTPFYDVQSEKINMMNLEIPPYLRDTVGIHLRKTEQLMRMGGIGHLSVANLIPDSDDAPRIVGMNSDGSAIASIARTRHKSDNKSSGKLSNYEGNGDLPELWDPLNKVKRVVDLDVKLDIESIGRRLSEKKMASSAKAWSKEINSSIRGVVMKEGIVYMLKPLSITGVTFDLMTLSFLPLLHQGGEGHLVSYLGALDIGVHAFNHVVLLRKNFQSRMSAFCDLSIDRAAAGYAMGMTTHRKLVAPIKS